METNKEIKTNKKVKKCRLCPKKLTKEEIDRFNGLCEGCDEYIYTKSE